MCNDTSACPRCIQMKQAKAVMNVETGIVYQSGMLAAKSTGLKSSGGITLCCQGKQETAGGFHWKYV